MTHQRKHIRHSKYGKPFRAGRRLGSIVNKKPTRRYNVGDWRLTHSRLAIRGAKEIKGFYHIEKEMEKEEWSKKTEVIQEIGKPALEIGLQALAFSMPVAREVYATYKIADAICSNVSLIKQCYDGYQEEGMTGVAKIIGKEVINTTTSRVLSDAQSDIIWRCIGSSIPSDKTDIVQSAINAVVGKLTEEEIEYVERFI